MLRVAEQYAVTDTGRQRRANEDSLLARSPLFVVADGMGGAQAGEVASRIAVESFQPGLQDASEPEHALAALALAANARIHELSHSNAEQAGMGTTLTAVYVGEEEVAIAHVGDSRAYCLRDGELLRLTDDHSLVDELLRQGRLTPEEAVEHPQRSVITRALGPGGDGRGRHPLLPRPRRGRLPALQRRADHDARRAGDRAAAARQPTPARRGRGADRGRQRRRRARQHHGRAAAPARRSPRARRSPPRRPPHEQPTLDGRCPRSPPPVSRRLPRHRRARRRRSAQPAAARSRRRRRVLGALAGHARPARVLGAAAYLALQSVYFIGTNQRGLVTMFQGVPYKLPGNLALYSSHFVSGVSASTLTPERRRTLLDHSLRSEGDAASLIRSLELGQVE